MSQTLKLAVISLCVASLWVSQGCSDVARPAGGDPGDPGDPAPDGAVSEPDVVVESEPPLPEEPTGECAGGGSPGLGDDSRCAGNVGCTRLSVSCGNCACTLCWNETCVDSLCDDGGPGCEVAISACGQRAQACGGYFDTPVYGGDPDVCQSGCASADSTCSEMRDCEATQTGAPLDEAGLCEITCNRCERSDCFTLCDADAGCPEAVLGASTCAGIESCPAPPPTDGGPVDGGPVDGGPVDGGPVDGGPVDGGA
jgi:hypothetical protein